MASPHVSDGMELGRLAEEQAALRRVATLVARGASPTDVFEAVSVEVGRLTPADSAGLARYDSDDTITMIGTWNGAEGYVSIGERYPFAEGTLAALLLETREPARIDDYAEASGSLAEAVLAMGWRSAVGAPVIVEGRVWGMVAVASTTDRPLPADTEARVAGFTELLSTAIANAEGTQERVGLAEQQQALREVATLVAQGAASHSLFAAVAEQVSRVLNVPLVSIVRYERDGTAIERASFSPGGEVFPVGSRWSLDGVNVLAQVRESGQPARINDHSRLEGTIAEIVRAAGITSTVGIPIIVAGRLWGAMVASSTDPEPLPENTEARLADFTELVATAISNSEAQTEVARLADEQAALRRVATLIAEGVTPGEVFAAVTDEVAALLDTNLVGLIRFESADTLIVEATRGDSADVGSRWPVEGGSITPVILRTRRPARIDDWREASGKIAEFVREELGFVSSVGTPILVADRVWGALTVHSKEAPLPPDTESRLQNFSDLVAMCLSNAQARVEVERLADEQAALRRVATLIAESVGPGELFAAVTEEVGRLLGGDLSGMIRYEGEDSVVPVAAWAADGDHPELPRSWPMEPGDPATMIWETRAPARIDDWTGVPGPIAELARDVLGITSSVGGPIVVEGRLWGALAVHSKRTEPLPADTESRMRNFTELVATAMSDAHARGEVERLAEEQAALRRVATLVAQAVPAEELLKAVAEEAGTLFDVDGTRIARYVEDREIEQMGGWVRPGFRDPPYGRGELDGTSVAGEVFRTGRVARIDNYDEIEDRTSFAHGVPLKSVVGAPIVVEGRRWGVMVAWSGEDKLPGDIGARLTGFTELVATAIANAEARREVRRLADEQAAQRRVATLVARGVPPADVFAAVAEEVSGILGADLTIVHRLDPDEMVTVVARHGEAAEAIRIGVQWELDPEMSVAEVFRTGRPARVDDFSQAKGEFAERVKLLGLKSSVGVPVVVEGYLWGAINTGSCGEPLPADTERRMAAFTKLVATAIANADSRAELTASRARLVAASDEARRRFERDLHDGVQQRLVSLSLELRGAEAMAPPGHDELAAQLAHVGEGLAGALDDLRELSRGIHPAILSEGGLVPALKALARRSPVPMQLELEVDERPVGRVEVAAYYVVSEALTNVAKHADATKAFVRVRARDGGLELMVEDDGVGGADPSVGSGLTGLADRVEALGGTIGVSSPAGAGTSLRARLPL